MDALVQGRLGFDLTKSAPEGPAGYRVTFDFTAAQEVDADLSYLVENGNISGFQAMYVDNSLNPDQVIFNFGGSDQVVTVAANAQKYINILVGSPMQVRATSTGGVRVVAFFLNFEVQSATDLAAVTAIISGDVNTNVLPVVGTPSNGSGVGTGASEVLFAANPARLGWSIQNGDTTKSLWVNQDAVAAEDTTSIEVLPKQMYIPPRITLGAINVIADASVHYYAEEY